MADLGIRNSTGRAVPKPLPQAWLGRADAPLPLPTWVTIGPLTARQVQLLEAQIGYDASGWDYTKIGDTNALGRYQFSTQLLEDYGLLAAGSNAAYGTDCVNYRHCWQPTYIKNTSNSFENYFYNVDSLNLFLSGAVAQDHLAYQVLSDCYLGLLKTGGIVESDSVDVKAGMIYVAWTLGVGSAPAGQNVSGFGAYAWRHFNVGLGTDSFNSGRYAVSTLS
jgi:hypothetical protein